MNVTDPREWLKMDREQLTRVPYLDIHRFVMWKHGQRPADDYDPCRMWDLTWAKCSDLQTAVENHVKATFDADVDRCTASFEEAFERDPRADVPELVAALAQEYGRVIIGTWARMTQQGIEQIDKARWIHKQTARLILKTLGVEL